MKKNPEYKQKGKIVGGPGGFFNQLMSHNESVPEVGKGATMLFYSDRHAYEVLEVNEKEKSCVIQKYNPKRVDGLGMSDAQAYEYKELEGSKIKLVYRWGGWKMVGNQVRFTDEARKEFGDNAVKLHEAYKDAGGEYSKINANICTEVDGLTKSHKSYASVNIIFGVKNEYYDFSF